MKRKSSRIYSTLFLIMIISLFLVGCSHTNNSLPSEAQKQDSNMNSEYIGDAVLTVTSVPINSPIPTLTPTATPVPTPADTAAPELTVDGDDITQIIARSEFTDLIYHAEDDIDGDITDRVVVTGEVDVNLCGTYTLEYKVSDKAGNTTSVERVFEVVQPTVVIPEGKVIYLTFDDGPGGYTQSVLNILAKYGVTATFFTCDNGRPELIKKIYEAGHSIGAHCGKHDLKSIYKSEDAYFEDLDIIMNIIYENTGFRTTLIRFPGGSSNTASSYNPQIMTRLTTMVEQRGYQYFDWNASAGDSATKKSKKVLKNLKNGVLNRNCSVVLMHAEVQKHSYEALEDFIIWAIDNGYTFLGLDPTSPTAHQRVNN